ncbi:sugar ABC transporter substrate-binding protein [Prescottella subtropica]|uniref:sugar ABC transporter substrate-binding protein n=1 Tax=Prescottella subtropica TaxID=2545757 RepID=UPI0010F82DB7|nr:substrate-binding domain-containing protein [Prescottella subtropica]
MTKSLRFATVAAAALLAAACSSNASSGTVDQEEASAAYAANKELVAAAYEGTFTQPQSTGPAAQSGKRVSIISCGESISSCNVPAAAMKEAGQALGWNVTIFDGRAEPTNYANGIREAVAAGVDGIIGIATDCDKVGAPLQEAKSKGIAVMGYSAFDCDDPAIESGDPVFSTKVLFNGYESMSDYREEWGRRKAEWIIDATQGSAKVLLVNVPGNNLHGAAIKGFTEQLAECSTCSVVGTVDITVAETTKPVAGQKLEAALLKHADANALVVPNDAAFAAYASSALNSVPRTLEVMGGECFSENLDMIRRGGPQNACVALPQEWQAWAVMDQMNRYFADPAAAPVDQGLGFQLVDDQHNLPDSGQWAPGDVDYKAAYKTVWGAK